MRVNHATVMIKDTRTNISKLKQNKKHGQENKTCDPCKSQLESRLSLLKKNAFDNNQVLIALKQLGISLLICF